jgi:sugar phosphate isomerase/epimerase
MKNIKSITLSLSLALGVVFILSQCKQAAQESASPELKISLAQWSIHRSIDSGVLKPENFASIAKNDFGINAIEYVASFYKSQATNETFWKMMRNRADSLGVRSLLIMVDGEGDLGSVQTETRNAAVANHYKWVEAARILGCHSIRVNAFGDGSKEEVKDAMIDALTQLATYASSRQINVIVENHGLYSSDGQWIADIMKKVNMPNCGTLPDFGNWCLNAKWGTTQDNVCTEVYDRYAGVSEMLPWAKGVSAKSYKFDADGNETIIDYAKLLNFVKSSSFDGYIGIEYEGHDLSEPDGIRATKSLLEKTWKAPNQPN